MNYNISTTCKGMKVMFIIEKELKNANIARTIRFTENLFEDLNQISANNNISFNLLVLQCCKYALNNIKGENL